VAAQLVASQLVLSYTELVSWGDALIESGPFSLLIFGVFQTTWLNNVSKVKLSL
jgi:hypothetical protein